mgnify:CR=1 FL=1
MLQAFKYYISQAFSSVFRNKLMVIISVSTLIFCMLLLGLAIAFGVNLGYISNQLESQFEIHAFVDLSYTEEAARGLEPSVQGIAGIADAKFCTKEEALQSLQEMLDHSNALAGLEEDNPLQFSYKITLKNIREAGNVETALAAIGGIESVSNRTDILGGISTFTSIARNISIFGMIIFAFIAVFIISNTIKLTLMARKKEIEIMKSVGATNAFIRSPFIIEGGIVGLIGGVISFIPAYFGYQGVVAWWQGWAGSFGMFDLAPVSQLSSIFLSVFIIAGIAIGALGSMISVRKYLEI